MSQVHTEGLLGRKLGMTQIFEEGGLVRSVTAIQAGPCTVTQVKTDETDQLVSLSRRGSLSQIWNRHDAPLCPSSREVLMALLRGLALRQGVQDFCG